MRFVNFYWRFIYDLSQITKLLISLLKTIKMEPVAKDLKFIDEGNIVDRVNDSNKVNRTQFQVDF